MVTGLENEIRSIAEEMVERLRHITLFRKR